MTTAMWICAKCGQAYGRRPDGNPYGATWHTGDCDVCSARTPETDAFNEVHCTCGTLLSSKIAALRKERDEARAALAMVSEDCLAWLNSESDEPSVEFIKAVQKFAHKESNAPLQEAAK